MDFQFQRHRIDKISRTKIIEELEKAAKFFNYNEFKRKDFNKIAGIKYHTVAREFGSWEKALKFLSEYLKTKGIELKPGNRKSHKMFTEKDLFIEMERIWQKLNHRPSKYEWQTSNPKISYVTYNRYFSGWQNACLKFIEYKMGGQVSSDESLVSKLPEKSVSQENNYNPENSRTIPLGIRLKVLDRDNFCCVFCGKSPATDFGTQLHIDHIHPYSKGGKSTLDNLQTLCKECNLGKSNKYDK